MIDRKRNIPCHRSRSRCSGCATASVGARRRERSVGGPLLPRKEEPVLARFWLTPTVPWTMTSGHGSLALSGWLSGKGVAVRRG